MSRQHQAQIQQHAAQMMAWPTESEARLWSAIKARQLGVQFRRQVVLGGRFIVDFLASGIVRSAGRMRPGTGSSGAWGIGCCAWKRRSSCSSCPSRLSARARRFSRAGK